MIRGFLGRSGGGELRRPPVIAYRRMHIHCPLGSQAAIPSSERNSSVDSDVYHLGAGAPNPTGDLDLPTEHVRLLISQWYPTSHLINLIMVVVIEDFTVLFHTGAMISLSALLWLTMVHPHSQISSNPLRQFFGYHGPVHTSRESRHTPPYTVLSLPRGAPVQDRDGYLASWQSRIQRNMRLPPSDLSYRGALLSFTRSCSIHSTMF